NANMLEAKRENEFFKLLKSDMLYAQSLASATDSDVLVSMSFDAENNRYSIIRDRTVQKRSFPDDWILDQDYIFYFNQKGTVLNPYTLNLKTSNARYQIVFPFGKGRGILRKNKGFSLIEVMTSFSIVLMLILTLLPIVSLLNKERDVLNKRSLISIRLHDTLQDYIRLEHVTPDTRQTT